MTLGEVAVRGYSADFSAIRAHIEIGRTRPTTVEIRNTKLEIRNNRETINQGIREHAEKQENDSGNYDITLFTHTPIEP